MRPVRQILPGKVTITGDAFDVRMGSIDDEIDLLPGKTTL